MFRNLEISYTAMENIKLYRVSTAFIQKDIHTKQIFNLLSKWFKLKLLTFVTSFEKSTLALVCVLGGLYHIHDTFLLNPPHFLYHIFYFIDSCPA